MPRGGRRRGVQGRQYPNRSDLQLGARQQPVMRAPSERYGQQAEEVRQQQALPITTQPSPAPPMGSTPPSRQPTQLVPLNSPTMRPDEPLTAGVDIGAGPGAPPPPLSANPSFLTEYAAAIEMLASLPDASDATRNLARRIRSEA